MRRLLIGVLIAAPVSAEWWNVSGPTHGPVPVNPPKCLEPCSDASAPTQSQRPTRAASNPQEEARRAAAAAAAAREEARRAEEARREYQATEDETRRLGAVGSGQREQARRRTDEREQRKEREAQPRALERSLAPVVVQKPAPGNRTPLSMKAYCDQLNAAAAPPRSLRPSEVPALPTTAARTAAFDAPPWIAPGRFAEVTAAIQRARAALGAEAKEDAEAIGWKLLERKVPFLAPVREVFEKGKAQYEALSKLNTRLATGAFTHAEDVALTVGGAGGRATPEDNDRLLRSMGRDVNDTTSKLMADQARGALKDSLIDEGLDLVSPEEAP